MDPEATRVACATWYKEKETCAIDHNKPGQLSSGRKSTETPRTSHRRSETRRQQTQSGRSANTVWRDVQDEVAAKYMATNSEK